MRFHCLKVSFYYLCSLVLIVIIIVTRSHIKIRIIQKHTSKVLVNEIKNASVEYRWRYICLAKGLCHRILTKSKVKGYSLQTCQMICEKPTLLPIPKRINYDRRVASAIKHEEFSLKHNAKKTPVEDLVKKAYTLFCKNVLRVINGKRAEHLKRFKYVVVDLKIIDLKSTKLRLKTVEEYKMESSQENNKLLIKITSETFFGARHGLETLSQLIWWDEVQRTLMILHNVEIEDEPAFPYRGLMIDTSRNYFSINAIKRNLRAMAACKLNVFHWHLTDSQSFPFVSPQFPELGKYGAYNKDKVYTIEAIKNVVEYANPLGIRVIIEIDAPAHMYEGWHQINEDFVLTSLRNGSGQLNPDTPEVFDILKSLYEDVLGLTGEDELIHIGADEVEMERWINTSTFNAMTTTTRGNAFYVDVYELVTNLWVEIVARIMGIFKSMVRPKYFVIWSSDVMMSQQFIDTIDHSSTIIQYWLGNLNIVKVYRYRVIFSDVNAWYLDCGFGQWTSRPLMGDQPCLYNSWYMFYTHSPWNQVDIDRVVGGEACLWSELVGERSLDARIWPRTAAFAEAVWTAPHLLPDTIKPDVFIRMDVQTRRLRSRGVKTQKIWPEWCFQHPGYCT